MVVLGEGVLEREAGCMVGCQCKVCRMSWYLVLYFVFGVGVCLYIVFLMGDQTEKTMK